MPDSVERKNGADRRLTTEPPTEEYRQLGWHCLYHEQAGRSCHNPLDCDMVPTWALTVEAGLRRMSEAVRRVEPEVVQARVMYQIWAQSDMDEGRGPMVPYDEFFPTEQAAWDSINEEGGIFGRHPRKMGAAHNWQQYKASGSDPDYDVRRILVEDGDGD